MLKNGYVFYANNLTSKVLKCQHQVRYIKGKLAVIFWTYLSCDIKIRYSKLMQANHSTPEHISWGFASPSLLALYIIIINILFPIY